MQLLKELLTSLKPNVYTFGRFNPPHRGHGKLFDKMKSLSDNYQIYVSQVCNNDNPFDYDNKIEILKSMFPQHSNHICNDKNIKTINHIQYNQNDIFVFGDDQVDKFSNLLKCKIVSAGKRDDEYSSTNVKQSVINNDFEKYCSLMPYKYENNRRLFAELSKKLKTETMNEGLIKLPTKLHKQLQVETESTIIAYSRERIEKVASALDYDKTVIDKTLKLFDDYCKKTYPDAEISSVKISKDRVFKKFNNFNYNDLPYEYKDLLDNDVPYIEWDLNNTQLKLHLSFNSKTLSKINANGQYRSEQNIVDINLKRFKNFTWSTLLKAVDKNLESTIDEILGTFSDAIYDCKGVLEHELTHYIQFKLMSRGSIEQLNGEGKTSLKKQSLEGRQEVYYGSQIEFDPQIKSVITKIVIACNRISRKLDKFDWKDVARYYIGELSKDALESKLDIEDVSKLRLQAAELEIKFFNVLKKNDLQKYKKAIKYVMIELENRID